MENTAVPWKIIMKEKDVDSGEGCLDEVTEFTESHKMCRCPQAERRGQGAAGTRAQRSNTRSRS
jgi:hypothetical protein